MISQHWFRWWLGAVRQQAITWANVDPDLQRRMASLGHNVLICNTSKKNHPPKIIATSPRVQWVKSSWHLLNSACMPAIPSPCRGTWCILKIHYSQCCYALVASHTDICILYLECPMFWSWKVAFCSLLLNHFICYWACYVHQKCPWPFIPNIKFYVFYYHAYC